MYKLEFNNDEDVNKLFKTILKDFRRDNANTTPIDFINSELINLFNRNILNSEYIEEFKDVDALFVDVICNSSIEPIQLTDVFTEDTHGLFMLSELEGDYE